MAIVSKARCFVQTESELITAILQGLWNGSVTIIKQDNQVIQINVYEVYELEERCCPKPQLNSV